MSIILSMLLAQARVLPEVDRRALDLQARAEAIQPGRTTAAARRPATPQATVARRPVQQAVVRTTTARPTVQQAAVATRAAPTTTRRPVSIRRAAGGALDLNAITTICRAAGNQADPATFLTTITRAYALDGGESQSLRTSCAAYLAGRADARTNTYGTPAH